MNVNGSSVDVTPNQTKTYTVELVNGACINAGSNQTICLGTEVTLSGSGAETYTWDNGVIDAQPFSPTDTMVYTVTGTDENGCIDTDVVTVNVESCIGINEINVATLIVYPNPSTGMFTISSENLNDFKTIQVQDNLGRVVYNSNTISDSINLSELANGKYHLILIGQTKIVTSIEILK